MYLSYNHTRDARHTHTHTRTNILPSDHLPIALCTFRVPSTDSPNKHPSEIIMSASSEDSSRDHILNKIEELKRALADDPQFAEFESQNKSTPVDDHAARLSEMERREQTLRRLHGLKDSQDPHKDGFWDVTAKGAMAPPAHDTIVGTVPSTASGAVSAAASTAAASQTSTLPPVTHAPTIKLTDQDVSAVSRNASTAVAPAATAVANEPQLGLVPSSNTSDSNYADRQGDQLRPNRNTVASSSSSSSSETLPAEATRDWDSEDHQYYLVNIGHREQRPKCAAPALRILAAYATREECIAQGQKFHALDPDMSIWMYRLHEPFALCRTTALQQDATYVARKVQQLENLYDKHTLAAQKDFDTNVAERKTGAQNMSLHRQLEKKKENQQNHPKTHLENARFKQAKVGLKEASQAVPDGIDKREQRFAVIRVLQDIDPQVLKNVKEEEPVVTIDGFFETELGATAWTEKVGANHVINENMDVVSLYAWLHPTKVDTKKIKEKYRNPEQNLIMEQKKAEKDRVSNYERWKANKDKLAALEASMQSSNENAKSDSCADNVETEESTLCLSEPGHAPVVD
jgi:hypothetical protein